jgi:hypothetical protein
MAPFLTSASQLMCPHGGTVTAVPQNQRAKAGGSPILRASDTFTIAGCPLNVSGAPHPCATVSWSQPAAKSKAAGDFALTAQSVGLCQAADQAAQGTVVVASTQQQAGGN